MGMVPVSFAKMSQDSVTMSPQNTKLFGRSLKILTFNTFGLWVGPIRVGKEWPKRMPLIAEHIRKLSPDIVLLQEVWRKKDQRYFKQALKDLYPYSASSQNPDRTAWQRLTLEGFLEGGLVALSKYPFLKLPHFQGFAAYTAGEEYFAGKGVQFLEIDLRATGLTRSLKIANTHLGAIGFDPKKQQFNQDHENRQLHQFKEILKWMGPWVDNFNQRGLNHPVVLAGDLNCTPHTWDSILLRYNTSQAKECYQLVEEELEWDFFGDFLRDLWRSLGLGANELTWQDTYRFIRPNHLGSTSDRANPYNGKEPSMRLDYIWSTISPTFFPVSSTIVLDQFGAYVEKSKPKALSDHYGVLTEFFMF